MWDRVIESLYILALIATPAVVIMHINYLMLMGDKDV
jgi:hypothetical protein